eukprot:12838082-Alexandrium_andersonii.AAC.1
MVDNLDGRPGRNAGDVHVPEFACHGIKLARPTVRDLPQAHITLGRHHGVPRSVGVRRAIRLEATEDVVVVAQNGIAQNRAGVRDGVESLP